MLLNREKIVAPNGHQVHRLYRRDKTLPSKHPIDNLQAKVVIV
jgi:hypothetical protein